MRYSGVAVSLGSIGSYLPQVTLRIIACHVPEHRCIPRGSVPLCPARTPKAQGTSQPAWRHRKSPNRTGGLEPCPLEPSQPDQQPRDADECQHWAHAAPPCGPDRSWGRLAPYKLGMDRVDAPGSRREETLPGNAPGPGSHPTHGGHPHPPGGKVVYVLLIVVAVIAGAGAIGLVGLLIWRWRRTHKDAARARPPLHGAVVPPLHGVARAAQPLPQAPPAIERPHEVHLHLHGVSAARTSRPSSPGRTCHKTGSEPAQPDQHEHGQPRPAAASPSSVAAGRGRSRSPSRRNLPPPPVWHPTPLQSLRKALVNWAAPWLSSPAGTSAGTCGRGTGAPPGCGWLRSPCWPWPRGSQHAPPLT